MTVVVAALYHFAPLADPSGECARLRRLCADAGLRGTLILAGEGINGTVAGPRAGIDALIAHLRAIPGLEPLSWRESHARTRPFARLKIREKPEIVTMGQPGIDPRGQAGRHVPPEAWNALIAAPDVVVIDTRNDYEIAIGSFQGAVNPRTRRFRDFPAWWETEGRRLARGKRVAMFCTGGIRCEKSTSYLRAQGVEEVFHLSGGILNYLETVDAKDSLWRGECFVFDGRVSLGHGLAEGDHLLCHACRRPVSAADRADPAYEPGAQCPACVEEYSDADRARFRERHRQVMIAARSGQSHFAGKSDT